MGNKISQLRGSLKKNKSDLSLKDHRKDGNLKRTRSIGYNSSSYFNLKHWMGEMLLMADDSDHYTDISLFLVRLALIYLGKRLSRNIGKELPIKDEDETDYPVVEPIQRATSSWQYYTSPVVLPAADEIDFPFLNDCDTISYIKKSKTMFIMRGISGSGKSTLVNIIQKVYPNAVVCSADFYFVTEDGTYNFQPDCLSYAHFDCQKNAREACLKQMNVIVIDNTNIRRWEMKLYLDMAREFNYVVVPVRPRTRWREDPHELFKRNKHGVGFDVIQKKIRMFEDIIPIYYGWFLNNITLSTLQQYYEINSDADFLLHCTAFYSGSRKNPTPGRENYHRSWIVQQSCGQVFSLHVTGITISPRVVTARVHLDAEQLELLWKPEETNWDDYIYKKTGLQNNGSSNQYPQKGRCAHITIATANGISASQANFDLLDICDKEYFLSNSQVPTCPTDRGIIKRLEDEYCVVYFDQPVVLNGLFSVGGGWQYDIFHCNLTSKGTNFLDGYDKLSASSTKIVLIRPKYMYLVH
ncbi:hypothetical protein KUTeg_002353, partial [Tegillarca granosa]